MNFYLKLKAKMERRIELSLKMPELKKASNPWVPRNREQLSLEENALLDIKSLLNKLTPEMKEKLTMKISDRIDLVPNHHDDVIERFFNSACMNKSYIQIYSELVRDLTREYEGQEPELTQRSKSLKKSILKRCQYEFKEMKSKESIILIGELYNVDVIPKKIIGMCINKMTRNLGNSNTLEMCCEMIRVTGKEFGDDLNKFMICLEERREIEEDKRLKFMIMDLFDLREKGWLTVDKGPKKIYDIRHD